MPQRKLFTSDGGYIGLETLEAASVGITLTDPNQPGNPIVYANQAFYRMTGYAPEETLGHNCKFLQGEETNSAAIEMIKAALDQRCECRVVIRNYQRNGNTFWNELSIAPVFDQNRELAYFIGFQNDVTSRVLAEEALRRSEQRVKSIIDATNEFIWEMNRDGVLTRVSPKIANITGHQQKDVIGRPFWDLVVPDGRSSAEVMLRTMLKESRTFTQKRLRILNAKGERMWLTVSGKPFFDQGGKFVSYVGSGSDITEQQLRLTDAARFASVGEIVGNISHEIRNPITILKGFLERLDRKLEQDGVVDPKELGQSLTKMLGACKRLENIAAETRDVILRKSNKPAEPTELLTLIEDSQRQFADKLKHNNVDFSVESSLEDTQIELRNVQFSQVLQNLFGNAIDALEKRAIKWIRVNVDEGSDADFIQISVTDSGPGIPVELRQKILEPLFTTKGAKNGTGLGLALCQNIVENHGGTFFLDEEHPNTRFVIQLPRRQVRRDAPTAA